MADLTIPKGDYGFYLNFTIQDSDEAAYLLTGYTIKLKVWQGSKSNQLLVNGTVDIVVAASGTCRYSVGATDFTARGLYNAELELTKASVVESTETFTIEVKESG